MKNSRAFTAYSLTTSVRRSWVIGLAGTILAAALMTAQTPMLRFTATSDNVAGAPDAIRIDIIRWSTDAERDALLAAWNVTATPAPAGRAAGKGAAKGKGGRGGAAPAAPLTPETSLLEALSNAPVVGHLWSSEVTGYSLRFASKRTESDGSERITLVTDRRLGAFNELWKPIGAAATSYEFSVIELRVNAKGEGEGKTSLTGKVTFDSVGKIIALENYAAAPVNLKALKRQP